MKTHRGKNVALESYKERRAAQPACNSSLGGSFAESFAGVTPVALGPL